MTLFLRRIAGLMVRPGRAWREIKAERSSTVRLLAGYVGVLALLALAVQIALAWFQLSRIDTEPAALRTFLWRSFWGSVPFLFVDLLNIWLVGRIANGLYPPSAEEPGRGLRIAAYASTPLWLARLIIPFDPPFSDWIVIAAFLYAPYLLYRGMAVVLDLPFRKALKSTAVLVLAAAVVVGVVNYILYLFVVL